jgi:hypothetical protein
MFVTIVLSHPLLDVNNLAETGFNTFFSVLSVAKQTDLASHPCGFFLLPN